MTLPDGTQNLDAEEHGMSTLGYIIKEEYHSRLNGLNGSRFSLQPRQSCPKEGPYIPVKNLLRVMPATIHITRPLLDPDTIHQEALFTVPTRLMDLEYLQ